MAGVIVGAVGGIGPFDEEAPVGLTEYGGGAGLVEGSPRSQSARGVVVGRGGLRHAGPGLEHVVSVADTMSVDEKLGVMYRASRASQEDRGVVVVVGPADSDVVVPAGNGPTIDPETGMSVDDLLL